jgi:hyperosmotically inducible protein
MQKSALVLLSVAAVACASSTADKSESTWDERQAQIEREREQAEGYAEPESTTVAGDDAVRDADGDGIADSAATEPVPSSKPDDGARAVDARRTTDTGQRDRDDTGLNERDRDDASVTPLDQNEGRRDLEITQAIRKLVIADDDLSFNAKNVKIITSNGKVTLRGPVESSNERTAIESSARSVPGVKQVDNQIEVKK